MAEIKIRCLNHLAVRPIRAARCGRRAPRDIAAAKLADQTAAGLVPGPSRDRGIDGARLGGRVTFSPPGTEEGKRATGGPAGNPAFPKQNKTSIRSKDHTYRRRLPIFPCSQQNARA